MKPVRRDVYRLHLKFEHMLDLRDREATDRLAIPETPEAFRDLGLCRSIAHRIRMTTRAQAMLVPSIAFLDDLSRWNLVVFLEKLPATTDSWITAVENIGPLTWTPD